jgi:hypothetical protein
MTGFWKRLMSRRDRAANEQAGEAQLETAAERRLATEDVEGLAADEVVEERLGGTDPERLVDDEFKP